MCFVANTDPSTAAGSHWIAVFVNSKNRAEFYDSYGRAPIGAFLEHLMQNYHAYRYNKMQVQSLGSSVCGQHCILFLYMRCKGTKMSKILADFESDTVINDAAVCLAVNEAYDTSHPLLENEELHQHSVMFTAN